jgi:ABC-2 type transport system permease protein
VTRTLLDIINWNRLQQWVMIRDLMRGWRTWRVVMAMFFQDGLVYKANTLIWILTDVVTAVIMPLIWLASYNGRSHIQGFAPSEMVAYYLVVLALTGFVESHVMWDMANDVKQGKFNNYLIRPYSMLAYMYAANLGWRVMRTLLGLPLFSIVAIAFRHYLKGVGPWQYDIGPVFWLSVVLGHLVSFFCAYALGLLSLWLYEARSVYNLYYLPMLIFSGQIAPLALLPHDMVRAVQWLPFPYTISFPAQIFLGRVSGAELWTGLLAQAAWIGIGACCATALWRGGVRRYTAFGI